MRRAAVALLALPLAASCGPGGSAPPPAAPDPAPAMFEPYRGAAERIVAAARESGLAHERLQHLCDRIGPRLSGSPGLDRAVAWAAETFAADGLDVRTEKVMVPVWVRGRESAAMTAPYAWDISMLGLGGSVGTVSPKTPEGIEAEVVVARDFDELKLLGDRCRGRIVLFDRPMQPFDLAARESGYGDAVAYRTQGPSKAAGLGAVACLVRSVTAHSLRTPHTGMLSYALEQPRIPAAAIATEDADRITRLVASGTEVRVRLQMGARYEPDQASGNVVADWKGSEKPDEMVLLGAHLDSWDVGQGAQDDGGGCMAVMEALRLLKTLGLRPRRTVRAVLFVNEENGVRGAMAYAHDHDEEARRHVAAIEADSGTYAPLGLNTPAPKDGDPKQTAVRTRLAGILALLRPLGPLAVRDGGGGADIGPLATAGVPQIGLCVEGSRYFDVHHTQADTFDKVSRADLQACAATLAAAAYVIADLPDRLDAAPVTGSR